MQKKMKAGTYNDEQIVKAFGTLRQKESFKKNKRLLQPNRETLLKNASRCCNITYNKETKEWIIKEVYKYQIPKSFSKMNNSLYVYICPLLLEYALENKEGTFTLVEWVEQIHMVNKNYIFIKNHLGNVSEQLNIEYYSLFEFYYRVQDGIINYLSKAMKYLQESGIIEFEKVCCDKSDEELTDKEKELIKVIETYLDLHFNISEKSERYFSNKSTQWKKLRNKMLKDNNISEIKEKYKLTVLNKQGIKNLLDNFEHLKHDERINNLKKSFMALIIDNAAKRNDNDTYINNYKYLAELSILQKQKDLSEIINITNHPFINTDNQGCYSITYKETGQVYIGESVDALNRIKTHINELETNTHHCKRLQELFNQTHNIQSFEFKVLTSVNKDSNLKLTLLYLEAAYYLKYKAQGKDLLNTLDPYQELLSGSAYYGRYTKEQTDKVLKMIQEDRYNILN